MIRFSLTRKWWLLKRTASQCSIGNGTTAILAGVVAQILEDSFGQIGPFRGAICLTTLALLLVLRWEENYGEDKVGGHENSSLYKQFADGWKLVANDSKVLRIGLIQALSEGGIYTVSFWEAASFSLFVLLDIHFFALTHWTADNVLCPKILTVFLLLTFQLTVLPLPI